jgi:triacylglycerol esterase/lipase EstA (alpha/beta hydrolase family)
MNKFRALGWTGSLHPVAYYAGDTRCTENGNIRNVRIASGNNQTSIREYGRQLAWEIHDSYSWNGRSVDIVAHSMGGLVARAAISGTAKERGKNGWPKYIYVEDVVTIGTPHNGTRGWASVCFLSTVCKEMLPGSAFLKSLAHNAQATGGTDWTMIGTEDDDIVPVASATTEHEGVGHYVWYYARQPLEHHQQTKNVSGTFGNRHWNFYDRIWHNQTAAQNIITTAKNACYHWRLW